MGLVNETSGGTVHSKNQYNAFMFKFWKLMEKRTKKSQWTCNAYFNRHMPDKL